MRGALIALVTAAGALAARALWLEPRRLVVRRLRLQVPNWPGELEGLRVAVVADLHTGAVHTGEDWVERIVERVNAERPGLVALLGDFVDQHAALAEPVAPDAVAERLGRLRAPLGVVAVLGNHDWIEGGRRTARALRDAGIPVLENEAIEIGRGLWVAGVADAAEGTAPGRISPGAGARVPHARGPYPRRPGERAPTAAEGRAVALRRPLRRRPRGGGRQADVREPGARD
jgi:uncharacterized protein